MDKKHRAYKKAKAEAWEEFEVAMRQVRNAAVTLQQAEAAVSKAYEKAISITEKKEGEER